MYNVAIIFYNSFLTIISTNSPEVLEITDSGDREAAVAKRKEIENRISAYAITWGYCKLKQHHLRC